MIFAPFNGNALILIVWIIMIFKPFIKNIYSPWGSVGFNEAEKHVQSTKRDFEEKLESSTKANHTEDRR